MVGPTARRKEPWIAVTTAAALGGVSPNLLQIAVSLTGDLPRVPVSIPGYCFALLLFAVLGAGTAWALGEKTKKRAFFIGISLPSFLQVGFISATKPIQPSREVVLEERSFEGSSQPYKQLSFLATPAYAQQRGSSTSDQHDDGSQEIVFKTPTGRSSNLTVAYTKNRQLIMLPSALPEQAEIVFLSRDQKVVSRVPILVPDLERVHEFRVPDFADSVLIRSGVTQSKPLALTASPNSGTRVRAEIDKTFLGGFLRAFGVYNAQTFDLVLEQVGDVETKP